ncbi:MAG: 3-isopropylmalate dehydratase small subunit [Leptospiraceae bacterium]|nr:3-isopropylmalate dehydratase small subunit [Leptospiraceae bacterium]
MEAFQKHTGLAAVLDRSDVDTDQIIPKQFLKKIERTGFGIHLFHDWRFLDDAGTQPNPDFILNADRFRGATVLVAGTNFGCGSSREHAPWALLDYGFKVIIAPSFADIFYNNCFKNGMLPIILPDDQVRSIMESVMQNEGQQIQVDLPAQKITAGDRSYTFEVDAFRKECLLNGWDDIGLTLKEVSRIDSFESEYDRRVPFAQISA